jgi:hypothetical protein
VNKINFLGWLVRHFQAGGRFGGGQSFCADQAVLTTGAWFVDDPHVFGVAFFGVR